MGDTQITATLRPPIFWCEMNAQLDLATRYRERAEMLRAIAEDHANISAESREALLHVAEQYEMMAITAERIDEIKKAEKPK